MVHAQARNRQRSHVQPIGTEDMVPSQNPLLRKIVMQKTKPGQVLWHKSMLTASAVARKRRISAPEVVVNPKCSLVRIVDLVPYIQIVVRVIARAYNRRLSHHGHATHVHRSEE